MFEFLSRYELPRDPGATFEYSNLGVGLLGDALARRAGTSYEALVTDRILEPLGIHDTRVTLTPTMRERLAQGYGANGYPAKNWDLPVAAALAEAERPRRDLPGNGKSKIGLNWFTAQTGPVEIV